MMWTKIGGGGWATGTPNQQIGMTKEEEEAVLEFRKEVLEEEKKDEEKKETKEEVAQVEQPTPHESTYSQILTQISKLKGKDMSPEIAKQIALVVQGVPYLSADLKGAIRTAATDYEWAYVAHASFLAGGASKGTPALDNAAGSTHGMQVDPDYSVPDVEASEIEGSFSTLETDKSNLDDEVSVLEHERSVLELTISSLKAEEACLELERSDLETERSAMKEDNKQEAEPLPALEGNEEVRALHAALPLSAKKEAWYIKNDVLSEKQRILAQALSTKKEELSAKNLDLERAKAAKNLAEAAKTLELERAKAAKNLELKLADAKTLELERAVSAKKDAFMKLNCYEREITEMIKFLFEVETTLQFGSMMSQAESIMGTTMAMTDETINAVMEIAEGRGGPGLPQHFTNLVKHKADLGWEALVSDFTDDMVIKRLKRLSASWSALIMSSRIIPKGTDTTKKELLSVLKDMRATLIGPTNSWPKEGESYPFANMVSQEVSSVQPIFMALLDMIGDCCQLDVPVNHHGDCDSNRPDDRSPDDRNVHDYSPSKTEVKRNTIIMGANNRPKRIQDGSLAKPGRYRLMEMDISMKLPVEIKSIFRKNELTDKLDNESFHQMLGHLCKSVIQFLKFQDTGVSTHATGVTGTLVYIVVHRLELKLVEYRGDGKSFATLHLAESIRLPTMTKACLNAWIKKCNDKEKFTPKQWEAINKLKDDLYGTVENPKRSVDDHGILLGIRVLSELMQKRTKDLLGPDYQKMFDSEIKNNIGELLGTGSYGLVFSYEMGAVASAVLKVPLLQKSAHIERELNILKLLGRQEAPNSTIDEEIALPVVMMVMKDLTAVLGGVKHPLNGFVFGPRGRPLTSCGRELGEALDVFEDRVVQMYTQVKEALEYMHKKNVFHNDVTPKNIIVRDKDWNVCVVDFGSACHDFGSKDNKKTGFDGTPNFAHKDIFMYYPGKKWAKLDGTYDYFGLGLVVSALFNKGKACWNMSPFPVSISDTNRETFWALLNERKTRAKAMIEKSRCSEEQKREWLMLISLEELPELTPYPPKRTGVRSGTKRKMFWEALRSLFRNRGEREE